MNQDRWEALMIALGFEASVECYEELNRVYTEKHRFYHTSQHIDAMLVHFDAARELADRPNEVELAIWFHDAVYKSLSKNNELKSALWLKEFVLSKGYDDAGSERLFKLVMATMHKEEAQTNDEKFIVDIDLAILGSSPRVFDDYENNVRKEYKMVPAIIYRKKRKELLKSFLSKDRIYNVEHFINKYERVARANIERAISQL